MKKIENGGCPLSITLNTFPRGTEKLKRPIESTINLADLEFDQPDIEMPDCIFVVQTSRVANEVTRAGYWHTLIRHNSDADVFLSCACRSPWDMSIVYVLVQDFESNPQLNIRIATTLQESGIPFIPLEIDHLDQSMSTMKNGIARKKNRTKLDKIVRFACKYLSYRKQIIEKLHKIGWFKTWTEIK